MVEGLELTLKEIARQCRAIKPDYIIELKQNYGTPFLAQYGSMTRAGDTPYNPEGNFLRTLHVQAYSPFSINDYQTITNADSPEDAACVAIKMIAVGIPTYSIDFDRLCVANKRVIAHYNKWYNRNIRAFMKYRIPLDGDANRFKLEAPKQDFFFLVNNGGPLDLSRSSVILNGTGGHDLFLRHKGKATAKVAIWNCQGTKVGTRNVRLHDWTHLDVPPGSRIEITL